MGGTDRSTRSQVPPIALDLAPAALSVARHFASGATMWCVSPRWPSHARHVAVEFVHPVIVGKRALPAVHVEGPDPSAELRVAVRPHDILLAVGKADELVLSNLMRHAQAWGLLTLWMSCGPQRPMSGAADHVIWVGEEDLETAYGGGFVLAYHLLWELAHVCFEHPGLLVPVDDPKDEVEVCTTCSDEGRIAEVVELLPGNRASVRTPGGIEDVDVTLIEEPQPGGLVLVHAGAALAIVDEARS